METLRVLLWKQYIVRKRRILGSLLELASTIAFFCLLFAFRDKLFKPVTLDSIPEENMSGIEEHEPFLLDTIKLKPQKVFYYPETNYTRKIMDLAGPKLNLVKSDQLSMSGIYYGIPRATKNLDNYVNRTNYLDAIVIFENIDDLTTMSSPLRYTIRMPEHGFEKQKLNEQFIQIQWAIDSSYIELRSHTPVTQKLLMQEFAGPQPPRTIDVYMPIKCILAKICCIGSLFVTFVYGISRLLEERCTGVQELVKMVGVSPVHIGLSQLIDSLPVGILYSCISTVLLTVSDAPLLTVPAGQLFLFFILQYFSIVALAFACSYIIKSSNHAVTFAFMIYLVTMAPALYLVKLTSNSSLPLVKDVIGNICGILPQMPVLWYWDIARDQLAYARPMDFSRVYSTFLAFICQIVLYLFLSWYLQNVRPGRWGVALPWNFMCNSQYWRSERVTPDTSVEDADSQEKDPMYFEEDPKNAEVGIKISNLYKSYNSMLSSESNKVLANVNLNIYKGEITILLGHNGAGKTTLMSIITGMIRATSGDVYVNGLHTERDKARLHKVLGLCPQHNLFFPDLTVLEHVMFFAMLKGGSIAEARESSIALLKKLNLSDKHSCKCSELSGGMKRRVQLTCALAGGAEVLVLDEPTSGLDVETRRELWDLLLSLRGSCTVLLTTHFMEEADALGDRVAVLHGGLVRSHATPMYLKRSIGSGYRLTLSTAGTPNTQELSAAIQRVIPDARVKEQTPQSICYSLPARDVDRFVTLFKQLEGKKEQLGIAAIGVGVTTLEEVFLQLCTDRADLRGAEFENPAPVPDLEKVTGQALLKNRVKALFYRQYRYTVSKALKFAILELIIPILSLVIITQNSNSNNGDQPNVNGTMALDDSIYLNEAPRAFYNFNTSLRAGLPSPADFYPTMQFTHSRNVTNATYQLAQNDESELNKYLFGLQVNDTDAFVLYSGKQSHAASVAISLLSNVLAQAYSGGKGTGGQEPLVRTYSMPISRDSLGSQSIKPKGEASIILWAMGLTLIMLMTYMNNIGLLCAERVHGARACLRMCGVSQSLLWLVALLYNMAVYTAVMLVPALVLSNVLDRDDTFKGGEFNLILFMLLFLGAMAFNAFITLITQLLNQRLAELFICVLVFVYCFATLEVESKLFDKDETSAFEKFIINFGIFLPSHNFLSGMLRIAFVARYNAICEGLKPHCPKTMKSDVKYLNVTECCVSGSGPMYSQFGFNDNEMFTPIWPLMWLIFDFVFYMILVMLMEDGYFSGLLERVLRRPLPLQLNPFRDTDVEKEKDYVEQMIAQPGCHIPDSMLVHNLKKNYVHLIRKDNFAVKGINFSVKQGECFGLLGVNGAGKSTTFKMLTGESNATHGNVFAHGTFLRQKTRSKYLQCLSYCPQFHGLDQFLTAHETLTLLLTLRGFHSDDVIEQCEVWIKIVGLEQYAHRRIATYSGGCARRMGTAAALSQRAALALLDEPTSGVDPASRRRVWAALRRGLGPHTAVIITSHSMDEMEVLCDRLAIMNGGWLCGVGPVPQLRARHATGHNVQIKLRSDIADIKAVDNLKAEMIRTFELTLKDSHSTMLHYHLNQTQAYSDLFSTMQQIAKNNPIIEDYLVSETTLEEVFLALAAKGKEPHNA